MEKNLENTPQQSENSEQILEALERLLPALSRSFSQAAGERSAGGITPAQKFLMLHISFGVDTVSDLAKKFGISLAAVSKMVESLVKSGYVVRVRSKEDRRIVRLEITDRGKAELQKNRDIKREVFKQVFSVLTQEEIGQFTAILQKLLSQV